MSRLTKIHYLPILVFIGMSFAVGLASWFFQRQDGSIERATTNLVAVQAAKQFEEYTAGRMFAIELIGRAAEKGKIQESRTFDNYASSLLSNFPGLQSIRWANPEGVIEWTFPKEGSEGSLGQNIFDDATGTPMPNHGAQAERMVLSAPHTGGHDGLVSTILYPVIHVPPKASPEEGTLTGYISSLCSLELIFPEIAKSEELENYGIWVQDGEDFIHGASEDKQAMSSEGYLAVAPLQVLNRTWQLSAANRTPGQVLGAPLLRRTYWILGLLLAVSVAIALHFWVERQRNNERALKERAELETRMLQSQKMEAIGRLAGGVAHDFNNLLTAILGNTDLLSSSEEFDDDARSALDQIRIAGERATQLTTQLLTISRRQVLQPCAIDLNEELRTLRGVLEKLLRAGIDISIELSAEACNVELDPGQLSQIVINLVLNAASAMPEGGTIRLFTSRTRTELDGVAGNWAVLSVKDTGVGMDEATRLRALEPFFTTREKGKGTGLGLATVDGITTAVGGTVRIEDSPPRGTRVSVWLPISYIVPSLAPHRKSTKLDGGVALVIEDEPSVLKITSRILTNAGYEVIGATNGAEALAHVNRGLCFDLLLTDAVMPQLGGRELLEVLRERGLSFDAVITSGYPEELRIYDLQRLAAAFLPKPFTDRSLREAVQAAGQLRYQLGEPV
ncbi:MAG: signal transduction histidine kinase/CheY-like chemotaxis protein [Planctomycetota bacterium]|jgi:signal transduction histidine kinase/CheY-like chemotaxis protein